MDASTKMLDGALPRELVGSVLSIKQLWVILWAHRLSIVAVTLGLTVLTAAIIKVMPRLYESTTTLLVAFRADDPVSGEEVSLSNAPFASAYFATQIEFILSPEILIPVVDKFKMTEWPDYIEGYTGDRSADGLRRWVAGELRDKLKVGMGKGSFFLYVTAEHKDPAMAANIANAVADTYVNQQVQRYIDPAKERALRYSEQVKVLKTKVDEAQAKVTEFRQRTGLLDLNGEFSVDSARLLDLDRRLTEATARRRDAELRLNRMGEGDATVLASPLVQSLKTQLQQKTGQMTELRGSLGARHPQILALQAEIEHIRSQLNNELSVYGRGASADATAAREVEAKLTAELSSQRKLALGARAQQDEAAQLLRELESATRIYQATLDLFDKVQMGTEMAVSNTTVVTRASAATKPVSRRARKLLGLAVIAGFGGSAMLCLLWELMHRRVRCREDMEHDLGIQVLIELQSPG